MSALALVVGAGPAGLSAAMAWAATGARVVVVEARSAADLRHIGEHLPPAALGPLHAIGLGPLLDDPRHADSSGVSSAWGGPALADKDYFFTPAGHGKTLCRDVFDAALIEAAWASGVSLRFETRLADLGVRDDGRFDASLRDASCLVTATYDRVIDASGRNARAARLLGGRIARSDDLVGVAGWVTKATPSDDPGRLCIEAVADGWWYAAPYGDGSMLCVYMTDASQLSQHGGDAVTFWRTALSQSRSVGPLARTGVLPDHVQVFDAATQVLDPPPLHGFLAVGDAAMAYDPLSSWGITKGLMDGHHGARALAEGPASLVAYTAARRADYETYRRKRAEMYSLERRWPHSDFWTSRQRDLTHA